MVMSVVPWLNELSLITRSQSFHDIGAKVIAAQFKNLVVAINDVSTFCSNDVSTFCRPLCFGPADIEAIINAFATLVHEYSTQ